MDLSGYRCAMLLLGSAIVAASTRLSAAQPPPPAAEQPVAQRTPEELADLDNWIGIVKNPKVELNRRTFNARKLLDKDWPEAQEAVLVLLDNSDGSGACIPVCRVIAQDGPPKMEYLDALLKLLGDGNSAVRAEAATVLSGYTDPAVIDRLIGIAKDNSATPAMRTSAIDALAQLNDSQQAAGILISLLDALDGQIDAHFYAGLARVRGEDPGPNPEEWRKWWAGVKDLTPKQWLARQLDLSEKRNALLHARITMIEKRLTAALEQGYFKSANGDKKALLKSHLVDELEIIRLLAIDIIRREIGDGGRPDDEVSAVLRSRLTDPSAKMRKGVLNILENLRNPDDAPVLITLLENENEKDLSVRLAAIVTLGQLSNPIANPILIGELQQVRNSLPCKTAAARSIGRLNAKGNVNGTDIGPVVTALAGEYEKSAQQPELRMALLFAMASIADPTFAPKLLDNLRQDQANVRSRCIAGLRQMGDKSHLDAILPYAGDADTGVRREVALAIGQLGSEDHLPALLNRLSAEPDASVRDILWASFKGIWSAKEVPDQLAWANKLTDLPDWQIELLKDLEDRLDNTEPPPPHLLEVRTSLATQYETLSRFDESAKYWVLVGEARKTAGDPTWKEASMSHFRVLLRGGQYVPAMTNAKQLLADDLEHFKPRLSDEIISVLDHEKKANRSDQVARLGELVKSHLPELLDEAFRNRLGQFEDAVEPPAPAKQKPPPSAPAGEENLSEEPQNGG